MRKQLLVCALTKFCGFAVVALLAGGALVLPGASLDLASSAHLSVRSGGSTRRVQTFRGIHDADALVLEWDEERDVQEVRVEFARAVAHPAKVEYWFKNWPYKPPEMPSMEDPLDDPWQGEWLVVKTTETCDAKACTYRFPPLTGRENPSAKNLPGTRYRRTLKIRLSYAEPQDQIVELKAFSSTAERTRQATVELGAGQSGNASLSGWFSVYNGQIRRVSAKQQQSSVQFDKAVGRWSFSGAGAPQSFTLDVLAAERSLPGSNDDTIITVHQTWQTNSRNDARGKAGFSFKMKDLEDGPIVIPSVDARVVDPNSRAIPHSTRQTIRERIPLEPEQTYDRASAEIPALDPKHREWGGPIYLPLAADSSWQKFAFELGGNVFLSKEGLRAKPAELKHLMWKGDRLTWSVRTGKKAESPINKQVAMRPEDNYLPIVTQSWTADDLDWQEQAFTTLLHGPLSPDDPTRSEQTPAILLLKITAHNNGSAARSAVVWLTIDPDEALHLSGSNLFAGQALRAVAEDGQPMLSELPGTHRQALKFRFNVEPGKSRSILLKLPAMTDLSDDDMHAVEALDFEAQRQRVAAYWRALVEDGSRFTVPEGAFNDFSRATIAHIHLTAKKDPETGLVMLGAASYVYDVYENETCYQILLLDALGRAADAATLLKPMTALQGSENFPGAHTGSFAGVFHGVKISDAVDYTANGYGLDHGTVLWTLAQHALLTRDKEWFHTAWPHMQKAIEWIEEQRKVTEVTTQGGQPVREYGLLPASKLEDNNDWANWFAINAFAYAGMDLTAKALTDFGYPEATHIRDEASSYRDDLRRSVLRATEAAPVVRLQDGTYQPYVPTVPTRRLRLFGPAQMNYYSRYGGPQIKPLLRLGADRDTLCGTVLLLMLGVFDVNEPIADWILNDWEDNETLSSGMGMNIHGMTDDKRWFSQGGMVFQANLINPIPVYLRRHEVPAAIRNLYNDFVACRYPEENSFTEEFHQWVHASGPFYKSSDEARFVGRLRETLVLEDKDELWLAAGAPHRWLQSTQGITVTNAPTFFGPVTYTLRAGAKPHTIEATVQLPKRNPARHSWLVVRTPSGKFRSVTVNGQVWNRIDPAKQALDLTEMSSPGAVQVEY